METIKTNTRLFKPRNPKFTNKLINKCCNIRELSNYMGDDSFVSSCSKFFTRETDQPKLPYDSVCKKLLRMAKEYVQHEKKYARGGNMSGSSKVTGNCIYTATKVSAMETGVLIFKPQANITQRRFLLLHWYFRAIAYADPEICVATIEVVLRVDTEFI